MPDEPPIGIRIEGKQPPIAVGAVVNLSGPNDFARSGDRVSLRRDGIVRSQRRAVKGTRAAWSAFLIGLCEAFTRCACEARPCRRGCAPRSPRSHCGPAGWSSARQCGFLFRRRQP
jgi:hypothetical protein